MTPDPQALYRRLCMCVLVLEYQYRVTPDLCDTPDSVFDDLQRQVGRVHRYPCIAPHPRAPVPGYTASERAEDYPQSVRSAAASGVDPGLVLGVAWACVRAIDDAAFMY